ncbi:MAG: GNAT family N-acetyltransferase [Candidatus Margulisbacteria bacterium]|nr:GNAT family N-acetyltransferase [Candidatus Margulisiibacteriota bacterium]MBU1022321.1 GNAT family N-acetyltransferase [Candidatus Margulisiibacteriota bacterium]MBU1729934.1 GNAT family N-acetyltransferase [Candidatus Margulisiibacteriota bacterium]MBU1955967.1 GNAT family N-acetyltransferase [Candidatus Margulisiibacteriota bacterium]
MSFKLSGIASALIRRTSRQNTIAPHKLIDFRRNRRFTLWGRENRGHLAKIQVKRCNPKIAHLRVDHHDNPHLWNPDNFSVVPMSHGVRHEFGEYIFGERIILAAFDEVGKVQGAIAFDIHPHHGRPYIEARHLYSAPWNTRGDNYDRDVALSGIGKVLIYEALRMFFSYHPDITSGKVMTLRASDNAFKFYERIGMKADPHYYYEYEFSAARARAFMGLIESNVSSDAQVA